MQPAVSVNQVSKKYLLRHERVRSFQQITVDFLTRRRGDVEEFWALRDISFDVGLGETFGIIGSNGSGKSTLLKLIARVISPTTGRIRTNGRVAALIELGAGFHPELTGRDNIYLHGSFMGFTRRQMDQRYDQIVDFAEVEHFIDTPLKHFSSGMMVRLGFATAISMDADLLIIDEVLAVGDIRFQRKCLDALHSFKDRGGTILLVAQDVGTVRRFCDRALLLAEGKAVALGKPADVIDRYVYNSIAGTSDRPSDAAGADSQSGQIFTAALGGPETDETTQQPPATNAPATIRALRLYNHEGQPAQTFLSGDPIRIELEYELREEFPRIIAGLQFIGENDEYIYGVAADQLAAPTTPGVHGILIELSTGPFVSGRVRLCAGLADLVTEAGYRHIAYRNRQESFDVLPVSGEEGLVRFPTVWSVPGRPESATIDIAPAVLTKRNGH